MTTHEVTALAIGGFDGIHRGHQALIDRLGHTGALLAIETGHIDLTPGSWREQFCSLPIFYVALDEIYDMDGESFVAYLRARFPLLTRLVVGYDFRFGIDRSAGAYDLKSWFGGEVEIVDEVTYHGISVHSTTIRNALRVGNVTLANQLIGREYMIQGTIIKGQGLGMRRLYPTLNLKVEGFLLPGEGVYVTRTGIGGALYASVSFVGHRVSTDGSFAVETHLLDYAPEHVSEVTLHFIQKMRDNQQFRDLESLKERIEEDIRIARSLIGDLS